MAIFGGLVLTNAGRNLEAKAQLGKVLKFKRIALGDGRITTESMITMNQLINEVLSVNIIDKKLLQDNIVKLTFYLSNQDLEKGFTWRELGVIAEDPDTKAEVLYCYGNARDNSEYISAKGEQDVIEKYVNIDLVVSNIENIMVNIDESRIFVTEKVFTETIKGLANKKKTWNIHISNLWTGDVVPYTKTISVEGLKETDEVSLYPIWHEHEEIRKREREAYNKISVVKSHDGSIELICDEGKPGAMLNARIEVIY